MADPFGMAGANTTQEISAGQVNHLPIVAHFARRLGLVEIVNRLVPTPMAVEPGVIVLGLVLDTLSGRSPLYHLQSAFEDCDRALLFGQELPAEYFSDDNVGRMLDGLFQTGTQRIFSALPVRALEHFPVSTHDAHFDTTSVSLYGDYLGAQGEQAPFNIAHGYSKDKRPDLKQFVLSLLCVDGNVPIMGKLEDGNASDKTINHRLLGEVSRHMRKHGVTEDAFIYIADSAMVTEANLAQTAERTRFITRLPATYKEHERVILEAIEADRWEEVGRIAHTPAFHQLELRVDERPRYAPGRPKKNTPRIPVATDYLLCTQILEKHEVVAKRQQMAGCFVLLSNLPGEDQGGYTAPSRSCGPTKSSTPSSETSPSSKTTKSSTPCFSNVPSASRHWA